MATGTTNPAAAATACWSCGAELRNGEHFCPGCGRVQPARPVDHFTFFGLPRKLQVDTEALQREFYRLSRRLHPDVYARASAGEQSWSLEKSSQLNDAYRTLKDPIERTEYLLGLEGVKLEEQSHAATAQARETGAEKKQTVPPDLLEEVFELNLQLEELRMSKQAGAADPEVVEQLQAAKANFERKRDELARELKGYWGEWDALMERGVAPEDPERVRVRDQMVDLLNRRSYVRNLVQDVNEALKN